jgi:hypothetical protein
MSRTTRRAAVALLAAGAVLALAGCATTPKAGSAAVVGEARLTDAELATQAQDVLVAMGSKLPEGTTEADINRRVISAFVQGELIDVAAQREGVTITPAQVDDLKAQAVEQSKGQSALEKGLATSLGIPPSGVDGFVRTKLQVDGLVNKLGKGDTNAGSSAAAAYLGKLATELGTEVSPRYGTWSPQQLGVGLPPTDLSKPIDATLGVPGASASPSPGQ